MTTVLMSHLHHTSWVHTDHHANPTEGRVLLLVVSDVPQRRTPAACNINHLAAVRLDAVTTYNPLVLFMK